MIWTSRHLRFFVHDGYPLAVEVVYSSDRETQSNLAELLNFICGSTEIFKAAEALGNYYRQEQPKGKITKVLIHKLEEQLVYISPNSDFEVRFDAVGFHLQFEFQSHSIPLSKKVYRNTLIAEGFLNEKPLRFIQTSNQETSISGLLETVLDETLKRPMSFIDVDFVSILADHAKEV